MVLETSTRRNWIIAVIAAVCFVTGVVLSHRIELGVNVQKVTFAEDTPALKFLPAGPGPHPVALLVTGYGASKEKLFRYGEALAAAGFVCFDVDPPGHGASSRTFTFMGAVRTLEAVAREVGPVDVFLGYSLGGFLGGEAVREGGMKPGLFIAVGSCPILGDHAPPLLLLAGRFDGDFSPALLKTRTDAHLVISPWSDHGLESWDPVLVNAAVEAACAALHMTPPAPPTAWHWRLVGMALAIMGAGKLATCLPELFPRLDRVRGLLLGSLFVSAIILAAGGTWTDATPHVRFVPKQGAATAVTLLLAMAAGRLRIPRWTFSAFAVLAIVIAVGWLKAGGGNVAVQWLLFTSVFTPALIVGTFIGWRVARRGSRLQGDIVMAIIVGYGSFQWNEAPRMLPAVLKPHMAIKLSSKEYDAFVGQYLFPADNIIWNGGLKLTILRQGDQLVGQAQVGNTTGKPFNIYAESETNFFLTSKTDQQLTFVKNEEGWVTAVIHHLPGAPDSEGKKLSGPAK